MELIAVELLDTHLTDAVLEQNLESRVDGEFLRYVPDGVDAILNTTAKDVLDNLIDKQVENKLNELNLISRELLCAVKLAS